MPETFEVETRLGFRLIEFDPDVFRFRDVRILIDGEARADMPFPKPHSPFHQVEFEMDGYQMTAISYLSSEPEGLGTGGAAYDLYADGHSLSDGSDLARARSRAAQPGETYPTPFRIVDAILQIVPAAGLPGFGIGIGRGIGELGWARTGVLLLVTLIVIAAAAMVASRAWRVLRTDANASVARRTALGIAMITACYGTAVAVIVLAIPVLRQGALGF